MTTDDKLHRLGTTATAVEIAISALRRDMEQLKGRQQAQTERIDLLCKTSNNTKQD